MAQSTIEWTQMTWNPTTGCTKVSAGCKFCYAERMAKRLKAMGQEKYQNGFEITTHPESLKGPYTWTKPKTVFVNSMSDLFHPEVPLDFIQQVFKVMADNSKHRFQLLTKRPQLVTEYSSLLHWPENVWMGVSVEDERVIDRIDALRQTGAYIKFLSLEPLIGPLPNLNLQDIDWVIAGGESGPKARPVKTEWIQDIRDQCRAANVPFFFKQWGGSNKKKNGRLLEGHTYDEMPVY